MSSTVRSVRGRRVWDSRGRPTVEAEVTLEDGTWGLVRASSNKPELVVVVESPVSEQRMHDLFEAMNVVLRTHPEVGAYNQTI